MKLTYTYIQKPTYAENVHSELDITINYDEVDKTAGECTSILACEFINDRPTDTVEIVHIMNAIGLTDKIVDSIDWHKIYSDSKHEENG